MSKTTQATTYLKTVLSELCQFPDELILEEKLDADGLLINVRGNPEDLRLLVGKRGSSAETIRHLMRLWGVRNVAQVSVIINRKDE